MSQLVFLVAVCKSSR